MYVHCGRYIGDSAMAYDDSIIDADRFYGAIVKASRIYLFCLEEKATDDANTVTVVCPNCCGSCSVTIDPEETANLEKKAAKRPTERISVIKESTCSKLFSSLSTDGVFSF
jgi:hypothetical protein